MIRRGFSLIEVMIALLISAMLIAGLFTTLYQVGFMQTSINTVISAHERAAIVLHQMERDLMGAFIPEQVVRIKAKEQEAKEEQEQRGIDKIFYATDRDGQFDLLTFITNNPLDIYLGIKNTKPKPRTVRVLYRLSPEKGRKDSYTLMRQEGTTLDFKKYKKDSKDAITAYAMVEGVASLQVNYLKEDSKKKEDGSEKRTYKKEKNWGTLEQKDKKNNIVLPEYVEVIISFWNADYSSKNSFTMQIPICAEPMIKKEKMATPMIFKPRPQSPAPSLNASTKKTKENNKLNSISLTLMQGAS